MKLKRSFFLRYSIRQRRGQALKWVTIVVSALAIAFTALSAGFLTDYEAAQREYYKSVSNRELIVHKQSNPIWGNSLFDELNLSFTPEEIERLQRIDGVEAYAPVVSFRPDPLASEGLINDPERGGSVQFNSYTIGYRNSDGKTGKVVFSNVDWDSDLPYLDLDTGEMTTMKEYADGFGYYDIRSFFSFESMELKCQTIDRSVDPEKGVYISEGTALSLGLPARSLSGLYLTVEAAIPAKQIRGTASTYKDDEEYEFEVDGDWCVETQLELPVRGILQPDGGTYNSMKRPEIFMSSSSMMTLVEENRLEGDLSKKALEWFSCKPEDCHEWRPYACYLLAEDVTKIDAIKEAVRKIAPDCRVYYETQDYEAITESTDNVRTVVFYISIAILSVVLLLSAIVYVSVIDRRKYEFAFLRANGLTKRELRKLVLCDTALQAVITFVVALVFAYVAHLLLTTSVGGFVFDGMTVLWLAVISVISVILPSVIALVLTNKYEPDAILRN